LPTLRLPADAGSGSLRFDEVDRKLLLIIIEKYQGGPVGLNTLAAALAEEPDALKKFTNLF